MKYQFLSGFFIRSRGIVSSILLLFILVFQVSGQSKKQIREIFTQAESILLYNEDYEMALPLYRMLTDLEPENHNFQYKVGICYLNIPGKTKEAIPWLEKAIESTTEMYSYSYKEDHAPVDAFFYLGSAYHILNQLDEAVKYYQQFLHKASNDDLYFKDFVRQQIRNCGNARDLEKEPVVVRRIKLDKHINAYRRNLFPVVSGNGQVMVYTAIPGSNHRILCARRTETGWSLPRDITDELRAEDDCNTTGLSFTGDTLLLYKEEGGKADIWMSIYQDTVWSEIKRLGRTINTKYWESAASLSADGKLLYFSSNRSGGYGGLDLYVSRKQSDGNWGEPKNLGSIVNTPLLEDNPFVTTDGKKLFFASQGHYNIGGFDIFYSEKARNGRWSKPVNIGYPVNTTDDNLFYFPLGTGDSALMTIVSTGELSGTEDIYRIEFLPEGYVASVKVKGTVSVDGQPALNPGLEIEIRNTKTNEVVSTLHPDSAGGNWTADLAPGRYKITFRDPLYKEKTEEISIPEQFNQPYLALETHLSARDAGQGDVFFIRSVYFDKNKSQLNPETREELFQIVALLKEYPALKFEIAGMADTSRNATGQDLVAAHRAMEVVDFFASQGITKDRFTVRATGAIGVVPLGQKPMKPAVAGGMSPRRVDIRLLRSDTTFRYKAEMFVPEYKQAHSHLTYSILMLKLKKKLPPDYFYRYNIEDLNYVKVDEVNGEYYYTLGSFKNKNNAIEMLGRLYSIGFKEARILDDPELEDILQRPGPEPKRYIGRSKELEEIPFYTVQIYALKKNKPSAGSFRNLKDVRIWPCNDGFVRYTAGNYQGWSVALKALEKVRKLGYRDAFIRPVSQLEEMVARE
ncbi:MAG: OmpA family protein [Chlorobi bacterium]|nr:OmpA family protein [Chlorobiota bacterium]